LENKWNEAYKRSDVATMESLLATDFIITVRDGSTFSKSGYIAHNGDTTVHIEITGNVESQRAHARQHSGRYRRVPREGNIQRRPYDFRDRFN